VEHYNEAHQCGGTAWKFASRSPMGTWLTWSRLTSRSDVSIKIHRADGNSVEIDARRVKSGDIDLATAIRQALDFGTIESLDSGTVQALDSSATQE
jgi:hypothetical protein